MKKRVLAISLILMAWCIADKFRIYIATGIWHMRHGISLSIGNYSVPVPGNWYVEDMDGVGQQLIRMDSDDHTHTQKLNASILVQERYSVMNNDRALAIEKSLNVELIKKHGEPVLERTFNLNDGVVVQCVGAYTLESNGILDIEPAGWTCSSRGLDIRILASEPDMNQVWEIIS